MRALREAKVMLLVFTSNANNSDEIKKELVLAGRHQVTVVPVRVEDVVPNDAFSYEFATRQWIDLFKNWEQEIELLSSRLEHVLAIAKAAGAPAGPSVTAPRSVSEKILEPAADLGRHRAGRAHHDRRRCLSDAAVAEADGRGCTDSRADRSAAPRADAVGAAADRGASAGASGAAAGHTRARTGAAASASSASCRPPPPAPAPAAQQSPEDAAWQAADDANTPELFSGYLKSFPYGAHLQEAQLRLANLIRSSAPPNKTFDGTWQTEWTCPNLGGYPGYSFSFNGQVKDGVYHGTKGAKGEPSSMTLDGKIEADGTAGFAGEIIVGSSLVGLGAARGTPSDFHALGHFGHGSGDGKRIEGRTCSLSFLKQ